MIPLLSALISLLSFRLRSRSSLELELIALRHQVAVLRRQRPGRPKLFCADRLLWVWLYRIWPQALHAMVLVKPATVIQWHRKGFRLYWRWRSQSRLSGTAQDLHGGPQSDPSNEHRQSSLGCAPNPRRNCSSSASWSAKRPSADTCRGDPRSPPDLAQLPAQPHERHRCCRHVRRCDRDVSPALHRDRPRPRPPKDHSLQCHPEPDPGLACTSNDRGLSLGYSTAISAAGSRRIIWSGLPKSHPGDGNHGGRYGSALALAERLRRAASLAQSAANVWITSSFFDERHLRACCPSYFHYYHKTRTHLSLDKDCPESVRYTHRCGQRLFPSGGRWSASSLRTASLLNVLWRPYRDAGFSAEPVRLYKCVTRMYWHPKLVHGGWVAAATVALLT